MSGWNKTGSPVGSKAFKFWPATHVGQSPGRDQVVLTDRGYEYIHPNGLSEVIMAAGMMFSENQSTDSSVAPVLTYEVPADGTYVTGQTMVFRFKSNEALSVAGVPQITITFNAGGAGVNNTGVAGYSAGRSTSTEMVFVYTVQANDKNGAVASVAYTANGSTITDIGGGAVTPSANLGGAVVTGIIIAD